ncbi:sensor histidine kinase [Kaistella polysaccharea]|uniref:sensor histidine kinase n=1 Tax=Kaistella polysaccharea TaxID=2878534 RepID=UPI001CF5E919|nr:sensor histidine kinase [Kaistella polysaccharea]
MSTKKLILNSLLVLLFIVIINTIQTYVLHITRRFGDIDFFKIPTHIFGIISCIISLVSTLIAWKITSKIHLTKFSRIASAFVLSIIIYAILQSIYYPVQRFLIFDLGTDFNMLVGNFVFTTVIFHLYISGLSLAYFYFQESAQTKINLQNTEKEKEILQYKILQKNLEPHFLFNNLSVLAGLVKKNPTEVEGFIDDFSDVYRYYLNHSGKELVTLKEELDFLTKYIALMTKRFRSAYTFEININDENGFILPCALQLCVENAIKHNRGSEENPLKINISRNENFIIISNDYKPVDFTAGSGVGNQFLQKSYELNFGKKVNFKLSETLYTVEIPLI